MPESRLTTTELIDQLRTIDRQLAELEAELSVRRARLSRTLKLLGGSVATLAGLILGPLTGGLTAFITGLGIVLCADAVREDAFLENEQRTASHERERLQRLLRAIELELTDRGL